MEPSSSRYSTELSIFRCTMIDLIHEFIQNCSIAHNQSTMAQRRDQVRLQPPWVVAVLGLVTILCGATSTVPVYIHGEGGYPCIRTPGLVKTASGALLAFAGTCVGKGMAAFPQHHSRHSTIRMQ